MNNLEYYREVLGIELAKGDPFWDNYFTHRWTDRAGGVACRDCGAVEMDALTSESASVCPGSPELR